MIDITQHVADSVKQSAEKNGIVTVFVVGSTATITTIEYEPGLKHDFPEMLSRVAPNDIEYKHNNTGMTATGTPMFGVFGRSESDHPI